MLRLFGIFSFVVVSGLANASEHQTPVGDTPSPVTLTLRGVLVGNLSVNWRVEMDFGEIVPPETGSMNFNNPARDARFFFDRGENCGQFQSEGCPDGDYIRDSARSRAIIEVGAAEDADKIAAGQRGLVLILEPGDCSVSGVTLTGLSAHGARDARIVDGALVTGLTAEQELVRRGVRTEEEAASRAFYVGADIKITQEAYEAVEEGGDRDLPFTCDYTVTAQLKGYPYPAHEGGYEPHH